MPVVIAVILAVVGYAVGYKTGSSQVYESAKAEGYREALQADKAKVSAGAIFPETHLTSLRGTVKSVNGDTLDIEVGQTVTNPLDEQAPLVRHVTVTKDTAVIRSTQKSDATTFKELDDYEKAVRAAQDAGKQPPSPPLSYTVEKIQLSDLKAGDLVIVDAQSDIARAESFVATSVRMETQPAVAQPPATPTAPTAAPAPSATTPPPAATTPPPTQTPPPPAPRTP